MPKFPLIPTIVVLAAVATMVALGFWQLGRAEEKAALIARYEAAGTEASLSDFPIASEGEAVLFRKSAIDCSRVISIQPTAGRNANGESGWAQRATCANDRSDAVLTADLGWSRSPTAVNWAGGKLVGIIAPGPRLIVTENVPAGLEQLAPPDPKDLPNNHLAYAVQWFFFAATALVIYVLALKRRQRGSGG